MSAVSLGFGAVILLVLLALAFDFMNGFHDAANAIATVVSTGVLKPQQAVMLAGFCNVLAVFIFHLKVASTVGKGIIDPSIVDPHLIFGALVGAIIWNIITWFYGIPSSSSHALIGGLVGAGIAKAGLSPLMWAGISKTVLFIFVSPILGFILGGIFWVIISWACRGMTPRKVDRTFRRIQLFSCSLYSLGHGGNDAQKTIGIIWLLLIATGHVDVSAEMPPVWVIAMCYLAMGLGTLFGGWRIVKTMGQKITKLRPVGGACAEFSGACSLFLASAIGVPVSTTHTITGAIVGVGAARGPSKVRWGVTGSIMWAWVLTIPASAVISALSWYVGKLVF